MISEMADGIDRLTYLRHRRSAQSSCLIFNETGQFETDVLAGFVLARAAAGLADSTIRYDTGHLELIRGWFGRPLWEMQPARDRELTRLSYSVSQSWIISAGRGTTS
jgi:hypothetical protein